jgi:hypothetical protein
MFEYISSGFTGSFLSYFIVFWCGIELNAIATDSISDRVIRTIQYKINDLEIKMDRMLYHIKIIDQKTNVVS